MWSEKSIHKSKWRWKSSSLIVNSRRLLLFCVGTPINILIHQPSRHVISTSACVFLMYTHIYLYPIMDRAIKLQLFDQILKCAKVIVEKFSSNHSRMISLRRSSLKKEIQRGEHNKRIPFAENTSRDFLELLFFSFSFSLLPRFFVLLYSLAKINNLN